MLRKGDKMKIKTLKILFIVMLIGIVTLACGGSVSTANFKSAYLATDEAGKNQTTVFSQDQPFYAIVDLKNAPDDTTVKAVWTAVAVQDTAANTKIDEYTITTGDALIPFSLTNDSLWPTGKYKVDLYLNDTLKQTLEFEVQ